jgi:hypothetical protein
MPLLLKNVLIKTERSSYSTAKKTSSKPIFYLSGIEAHIMPTSQASYKLLPAGALESDYVVTTDTGIDIREGDAISSITLPDGTPWPGLGAGTNPNDKFWVVYIQESTPGPLAHRNIYVSRERTGGPSL